MLVLGLGLLVWSLWSVRHYSPSESYVVAINTTEGVLHTTNPKFLSFGLDSSLLRDRKKFPIDDERFATLARWLSPAWVRVGGTSADCLFFNKVISELLRKFYNLPAKIQNALHVHSEPTVLIR